MVKCRKCGHMTKEGLTDENGHCPVCRSEAKRDSEAERVKKWWESKDN